ncbi:hypothetical protein ASG03_08720 [Rhizobium sp. Leaf341]|nr:hypothetical protein ASG03_08720 [Rhizobium sp. Leaf341]
MWRILVIGSKREDIMTASEIERLEQAARSVFGHDDGEAIIVEEKQGFIDRIRAYVTKRLAVRAPMLPGA